VRDNWAPNRRREKAALVWWVWKMPLPPMGLVGSYSNVDQRGIWGGDLEGMGAGGIPDAVRFSTLRFISASSDPTCIVYRCSLVQSGMPR
jgi:hypothetical protein